MKNRLWIATSIYLAITLTIACCPSQQPAVKTSPQPSYISNIKATSFTTLGARGSVTGGCTSIRWKKKLPILFVTAAHLVKNYQDSTVFVAQPHQVFSEDLRSHSKTGKKIPCRVLIRDDELDIIILASTELAEIDGPSSKLAEYTSEGEPIRVIGSPSGFSRSISQGVISKHVRTRKYLFIKTDAAMYYGSSGGGMFNSKQELVGVGVAIHKKGNCPIPGGGLFVHVHEVRALLNKHNIRLE